MDSVYLFFLRDTLVDVEINLKYSRWTGNTSLRTFLDSLEFKYGPGIRTKFTRTGNGVNRLGGILGGFSGHDDIFLLSDT